LDIKNITHELDSLVVHYLGLFMYFFVIQVEPELYNKMSSTSQKHRDFLSEPMADKDVTSLAGIGPVLGQRLSGQGFDKVSCTGNPGG
jgi:hypothetical protein